MLNLYPVAKKAVYVCVSIDTHTHVLLSVHSLVLRTDISENW